MRAWLATAALLTAAQPASAAINLIRDGAFTEGASAGSYKTYAIGSLIGPWLVTSGGNDLFSGSVDLVGGLWAGPNGGYSVDLDGTLGNCKFCSKKNAAGGLTQLFNVASSGDYNFTFNYAANGYGGPPAKGLEVIIGSLGNFTTQTLSPSNSAPDYLLAHYVVHLNAGVNDLSFLSTDARGNQFGPVIANVAVSAVPEPTTWAMMLMGFAGLLFAGRSAARKSALPAA